MPDRRHHNVRNELIRAAGQLDLFVMQPLRGFDAAQLHPAISRNLAFEFLRATMLLGYILPRARRPAKTHRPSFFIRICCLSASGLARISSIFCHKDRCCNLHPNPLFLRTRMPRSYIQPFAYIHSDINLLLLFTISPKYKNA